MTAVRITASQRDALYEHILIRLSGIGDLWTAVFREDFDTATRLGREYSDDLRLLLDDLGWGETGEDLELTAPPDVLRRIFSRLQKAALSQRRSEEDEWTEARNFAERNRLVAEASEAVLADLGSVEAS